VALSPGASTSAVLKIQPSQGFDATLDNSTPAEISAKDPVAALYERRKFQFRMENAAVIHRRYIDG
jgi:hypothetical protein